MSPPLAPARALLLAAAAARGAAAVSSRLAAAGAAAPHARRLAAAAAATAPGAAAAAAAAPDSAPTPYDHAFPAAPGSVLRVLAGGGGGGALAVRVGNAEHDVISLRRLPAGFAASVAPLARGAAAVSVERALGAAAAAADDAAAGTAPAAALEAAVPERFCSLEVHSAGGDVTVATIVEAAAFAVRSGGGAVSLGRVRAVSASADAGGGPLTAREVGGSDVKLAGGEVRVARLVGTRVALAARGPATLGALYAEASCAVAAAGLDIATMAVTPGLATLEARGGGIRVGGLDGGAALRDAAGGAVAVQLNAGCTRLEVDATAGGDVDVAFSPDLRATLRVESASGRVTLEGATLVPDGGGAGAATGDGVAGAAPGPLVLQGRLVPATGAGAAAEAPASRLQAPAADGGPPAAIILIRSGGAGRVTVRALDWMAALRAKLAARGGAGGPGGQAAAPARGQ